MVEPKIYVFSDLDDTLIQTRGKHAQGTALETGAYGQNGMPLSFFSRQQKTLLSLLEQTKATIIPVTGRSSGALARVNYPFRSYAVVSHGAVVLKPDQSLCDKWLNSLNGERQDWASMLDRANRNILECIKTLDLDARTRVVVDHEVTAYVSVKGTESALTTLEPLAKENPLLGFHRNIRNLALLPPYASKKRAVEHVKQSLDIKTDDLILGMGDSMTDLSFICTCHFGVIPTNSQIIREFACE